MGLGRGAVGLAEGVASADQRDGFLVVHRHALEGFADECGRRKRVAVGVRTFRIDVDQAHLGGAEGILEAIEWPMSQPGGLRTPVYVLIGFPGIFPASGKAECAKAHGLQRYIAGEDQQIRPRNLLPVFLLDRPQQPAIPIDQHVVGPRIERRETLLAATGTTTAIA